MQQLDLIPPPAFAPDWPTAGLAVAALNLMLNGRTIDHPSFETETGSWRLSAVVLCLKRAGWPVESIEAPDALADGTPRTISRYRLPAEIIALARESRQPARVAA